ncbi:MAG: sulfatase-like hydrolase/transferase [Verrucomicrobiota bacterium]
MKGLFLVTLLLSLAGLSPAKAESDESSQPPNIVLILADDLGYADLGCYGSTTNHTPNLDALAAAGLRFTDFHSNGTMCSPTRAALLTGLYQQRFGSQFETALSAVRNDPGLPLEALTIAEVLSEAGYATSCFGKWHLGYQAPFLPTNQGFNEFRGLLSGDGDFHTQVDRSGNPDWYHDGELAPEKGYTTDLLTHHAVDFIDRYRDSSFFLYVPHLAVHFPWQGPEDPPHRKPGTEYHKDKWGIIPDRSNIHPHLKAMIESLDDSVGAITSALKKYGLTENTLVIFTSDNGGYLSYPGGFQNISDMGPFRGQKAQVYEGGHRVPAIISWPGKITPGLCKETVMTHDLFPTLARLAGINLEEKAPDLHGPKDHARDGVDLTPLLLDSKPIASRTLFWRMGPNRAVRSGPHKLCLLGKKAPELYHLEQDPGETTNIAAQHPELVSRLTQSLITWEQNVDQSAKAHQ